MFSLSLAQQNQNTQNPNPEIESLKNRISELESKLQTVENVEKMELAAKLADANAKLANAEFGKFERDLRDSNNKWLWAWIGFFVGILAVIGIAVWFVVKSLIADGVEKKLNGFKEAVAQVNTLKNELKY
jgi:type IV secretory pathway component VirB8